MSESGVMVSSVAEGLRPRVTEVVSAVVTSLEGVVRQHGISHEEYRAAIQFLVEVGEAGEIPLLIDTFLNVTVADVNYPSVLGATEGNILGPYYLPNSPLLEPPCRLGRRSEEPGDPLVVSGYVRSAEDGAPIEGAELDIWQASGDGKYDHLDPGQPDFNFRGRILTGEGGGFEFRTVVPGNYQIKNDGPVGRLLEMMGRHAFRPAHIHFIVRAAGYRELITQLYFEGDPYLGDDAVKGASSKPSLVVKPSTRSDDGWLAVSYDFLLLPACSSQLVAGT